VYLSFYLELSAPAGTEVWLIMMHGLSMDMGQSVPKRRHIYFRRRGITQKKEYNIYKMAKVGNQEVFLWRWINNQLYAEDDVFIGVSTCFGHHHARHQENGTKPTTPMVIQDGHMKLKVLLYLLLRKSTVLSDGMSARKSWQLETVLGRGKCHSLRDKQVGEFVYCARPSPFCQAHVIGGGSEWKCS
jgi:hypothetical protein